LSPLGFQRSTKGKATAEEQRRLLVSALMRIELSYREVSLLRDVEGLSAPEAAQRLGIVVDALKSRSHRARLSMRDAIDRGPAPPKVSATTRGTLRTAR
jgi:RNA polymerase sigma-70 factor (ECF subfamily)